MKTLDITYEDFPNDVRCVRLSGRLDIPGVRDTELRFTILTSTRGRSVIVDLSQVELITSIGLSMLITNARTLRMIDQRMVLLNPQPHVAKVIRLSGVSDLLPIEDDLDSAIERLSE